ncbi:MAG: decaprenyl-phosphate phosphoribosyltransferase [Phenylobacterium sp.]|jgi:decaprenyl-phosphate phosphoribosyltransferase
MRPHQYIKNLFILLPLYFGLKMTDLALLFDASMAFIAFSLTASAVYILNDYCDIAADRLHPSKKHRPLAAGTVSKQQAVVVFFALLGISFAIMATLSVTAAAILACYLVLNIAYSLSLKHVAIIDVSIIAIGFVLRLFVGSTVTAVPLSTWIVLMTFLLTLFIALAKRRDDMLIYLKTGQKTRKVIDGYNLKFLDIGLAIMASVVIVGYIIYTTSMEVVQRVHSEYLYLTSLFVILGVFRYLQIAFIHQDSGSPTKIVLNDRFIQVVLLGWIVSFTWILY